MSNAHLTFEIANSFAKSLPKKRKFGLDRTCVALVKIKKRFHSVEIHIIF